MTDGAGLVCTLAGEGIGDMYTEYDAREALSKIGVFESATEMWGMDGFRQFSREAAQSRRGQESSAQDRFQRRRDIHAE
jgi:hypothetical protein